MAAFSPKISIIIPVYNGSKYLAQAVDSALAQSYPNREVIVVNDGSNDEGATSEIARGYGNKILYYEKSNGGVASALNFGISKMSGEYVSWLSHDDVYLPDKLSTQVAKLRTLPEEQRYSTMLFSDYRLIDEKNKALHEFRCWRIHHVEKLNTPLYALTNGLIHGCTLLIPRKAFQLIGLFDETLRYTQDYDLWLKFARRLQIAYCQRTLICSRFHAEQDSKKSDLASKTRREDETNKLWIKIFGSITAEERVRLAGSRDAFFRNALRFLTLAEVPDAFSFVFDQWRAEKDSPLVSVVIPFFNRIDFTLEAIESALSQTYPNLEVIVVDDGSTESTAPILQRAETDSRLIYLRQDNKGPAAARNLGVQRATGSYVCFLDSDDRFLPTKVEKQVNHMLISNSSFTHTSYLRMNEQGKRYELVNSGDLTFTFPAVLAGCPIATPTVMVNRELMRSIPFEETLRVGEDVVTWSRIAKVTDLVGIPIALTDVRIMSTTTAFDPAKSIEGEKNISTEIYNANFRHWVNLYARNMAIRNYHLLRRTVYRIAAPLYRLLPDGLKPLVFRIRGSRYCSGCGRSTGICCCPASIERSV